MVDVIGPMVSVVKSVLGVGMGIFSATIGAAYPPYGLLWKYLYFCIISSLIISIFLLGGLVTPFIGIVYIYYLLYKRIKCFYIKGKPNQPPECF
jgi:hypothetical protein